MRIEEQALRFSYNEAKAVLEAQKPEFAHLNLNSGHKIVRIGKGQTYNPDSMSVSPQPVPKIIIPLPGIVFLSSHYTSLWYIGKSCRRGISNPYHARTGVGAKHERHRSNRQPCAIKLFIHQVV